MKVTARKYSRETMGSVESEGHVYFSWHKLTFIVSVTKVCQAQSIHTQTDFLVNPASYGKTS